MTSITERFGTPGISCGSPSPKSRRKASLRLCAGSVEISSTLRSYANWHAICRAHGQHGLGQAAAGRLAGWLAQRQPTHRGRGGGLAHASFTADKQELQPFVLHERHRRHAVPTSLRAQDRQCPLLHARSNNACAPGAMAGSVPGSLAARRTEIKPARESPRETESLDFFLGGSHESRAIHRPPTDGESQRYLSRRQLLYSCARG